MWDKSSGSNSAPPPSTVSALNWFNNCLSDNQSIVSSELTCNIIVLCWFIWLERNKFLFEDSRPLAVSVFSRAASLWVSFDEAAGGNIPQHKPPPLLVKWSPPPENRLKFNVDGGFKRDSNSASIGGCVRDSSSSFICGFAKKVVVSSPLICEALAIQLRSLLQWRFEVSKVFHSGE